MNNQLESTCDSKEMISRLQQGLKQVIKGKDTPIRNLLTGLLSQGHILIEDVPGVGKTTLTKALARLISADYSRIQFTPDLLPADITGTSIFNSQDNSFEFKKGPVFSNILLTDEINRASPRTQSALLEAMAESQVTYAGQLYQLPSPFMVIATQNPMDYHGTFPLPEAQLDRFSICFNMEYPSLEDEIKLLSERKTSSPLEKLEAVITRDQLIELQRQTREISFHEDLVHYLASLLQESRNCDKLNIGFSPRCGLVLYRTAQATAMLNHRDFVSPEDILDAAQLVLAHRLSLKNSMGLNLADKRNFVQEFCERVPLPR